MKYTSAEANKLLKSIQGRINDITRKEDLTSSFRVAAGEDESGVAESLFSSPQEQRMKASIRAEQRTAIILFIKASLNNLENIEFKIIGLFNSPEDRVIGRLLAALYLSEADVCVCGC